MQQVVGGASGPDTDIPVLELAQLVSGPEAPPTSGCLRGIITHGPLDPWGARGWEPFRALYEDVELLKGIADAW